jgi:hypothetical protein
MNEEEDLAQPNGIVVRVYGTHYGDVKIICTFPGDIQREMIIDVTVAGTHAAIHTPLTKINTQLG